MIGGNLFWSSCIFYYFALIPSISNAISSFGSEMSIYETDVLLCINVSARVLLRAVARCVIVSRVALGAENPTWLIPPNAPDETSTVTVIVASSRGSSNDEGSEIR
jgi:hypothetical protein